MYPVDPPADGLGNVRQKETTGLTQQCSHHTPIQRQFTRGVCLRPDSVSPVHVESSQFNEATGTFWDLYFVTIGLHTSQ